MPRDNTNQNENSNQRKPADGFLNIWLTMKDGTRKKVAGVALDSNKKLHRSILAKQESVEEAQAKGEDVEFDLNLTCDVFITEDDDSSTFEL